MLSLYIHIPFCAHKCAYCSFFVLPEDGKTLDMWSVERMKQEYLEALLAENALWYKASQDKQVKTIYIWWGTPFQLWAEKLLLLIDSLLETRDCEFLEELTIELNPDPFDEVLAFVEQANKKYKHLYKLRYSFGIQTFDDSLLQEAKRNYVFNNLVWFLRELQQLKAPHVHYNFDFIAFGKEDNGLLRDRHKMEFFIKFVNSHVADWFSLYTLELFPWSDRYNALQKHIASDDESLVPKKVSWLQGNDDAIYKEFDTLSAILIKAWYERYEISNFALRGKPSIHNIVYWNMQPYIGLGIQSSSLLPWNILQSYPQVADVYDMKGSDHDLVRFHNTKHWKKYLWWSYMDFTSLQKLSRKDKKIEKAFLLLRTNTWLKECSLYTDIFVKDWKQKISVWQDEWLVMFDKDTDHLRLTHTWMNVYNGLITDLFAEF